MSERRTEADGWQAVWHLERHCIRIMLVRNILESRTLMSISGSAAPDLVQVREQFPNLSSLWDAVRHEYWAEFFTAQEHSRGTI